MIEGYRQPKKNFRYAYRFLSTNKDKNTQPKEGVLEKEKGLLGNIFGRDLYGLETLEKLQKFMSTRQTDVKFKNEVKLPDDKIPEEVKEQRKTNRIICVAQPQGIIITGQKRTIETSITLELGNFLPGHSSFPRISIDPKIIDTHSTLIGNYAFFQIVSTENNKPVEFRTCTYGQELSLVEIFWLSLVLYANNGDLNIQNGIKSGNKLVVYTEPSTIYLKEISQMRKV